jgi:hypothetical protein
MLKNRDKQPKQKTSEVAEMQIPSQICVSARRKATPEKGAGAINNNQKDRHQVPVCLIWIQ